MYKLYVLANSWMYEQIEDTNILHVLLVQHWTRAGTHVQKYIF